MTGVSVRSFHRGLAAEGPMSAAAGNYERSTAGIILEVIVGLLTAGVGVVAFEVYHAKNRASKSEEFASLAEKLLQGMQGISDKSMDCRIDYPGSVIEITPRGNDIKITFGGEEKIIESKTIAEIKENLKREIVSRSGLYTNEALKMALLDTDNQRPLVEDFLRSVIKSKLMLDDKVTEILVSIAIDVLDKKLAINDAEKILGSDNGSGWVIDVPIKELMQQYKKALENSVTAVNQPPATGSRAHQDDKEKKVRHLCAEILFPDRIWEINTVPPGSRLKKVLLENTELLTQLHYDSSFIAAAELPERLQHIVRTVIPVQDIEETSITDVLNSLSDGDLDELDKKINQMLTDFKLSHVFDMSAISGMLLSGEGNFQKFLKNIFENYFDAQHVIDKRAMLASFLENSRSKDSNAMQLVALLKGSGPYLQKVLQLVGDNAGGELKAALDELKTNINPVNEEIVQAILDDIASNSGGRIEKIERDKDLGAASIGQAVLAKIFWKGKEKEPQEVVVKILRPGIRLRAHRELKFFKETAKDIPGMPKTLEGIVEQIQAEMDLRQEAKYVCEAQVYNNDFHNLQAMKLLAAIRPAQDYMVIEKAPGITVKSALDDLRISMRREIASQLACGIKALATKWVEEALFKSGFYHGDLHSGNIMFDESTGMTTVIDMGNAMVLSWKQRKAVFQMVVAAALREPGMLASNYEALLSGEGKELITSKRYELFEKIKIITKDKNLIAGRVILDVLDVANNMGLEIPATIANFSRSLMMLQNAIDEINDILGEIKDVNEQIPPVNFPQIFMEVFNNNRLKTMNLIQGNTLSTGKAVKRMA